MKSNIIKVGIIGISGYTGLACLELLLKHPQIRLTYVGANTTEGPVDEIWPRLRGLCSLTCKKFDINEATANCETVFLAVPHNTSMEITPQLLNAGLRVIDLSGDYRLGNANDYAEWYGMAHKDADNLKKAVYGLPELYRESIKEAQLLSNPGCYPTASLLSLLPIATTQGENVSSIIIDAKSGVSGAGRKVQLGYIFPEVDENFKAYKVLNHQHEPEINLYLKKVAKNLPSVNFVPHLLPVNRGILATVYVQLQNPLPLEEIHQIYTKFYKTEPFVRVLKPGLQPELKNVTYTNYCDIGLAMSKDSRLLVVTSVIDNLIKGAAGQAVQNMNIMNGFTETEGLGTGW